MEACAETAGRGGPGRDHVRAGPERPRRGGGCAQLAALGAGGGLASARADWAPVGAGRLLQHSLQRLELALIPAHSQRGKLRCTAGKSVVWKRGAAEPWAGAGEKRDLGVECS